MKNNFIMETELLRKAEEYREKNVTLPRFISKSVETNKTSLGDHPAFPPTRGGNSFIESILKKRYLEVLVDAERVESLNRDISKENVTSVLIDLINKAVEYEVEIKGELEKLAINFIYDMFNINESDVIIKTKIKNGISTKENVSPPKDDFEFDDIEKMEYLDNEVYKRRLLNSLVQGASVRISENLQPILNDLYTLNPKLIELYSDINKLMDYLTFIREMKPTNNNLYGTVTVNLSSEDPIISAEGRIFPFLLFHLTKGIMELLSANGLPDDKEEAQYILNRSDFLLLHNWDKRLGVGLWDIIMDDIGHSNFDIMPHVFSELISEGADTFHGVIKNVFANTKKGQEHIKNIINYVETDAKYQQIEDSISYDKSTNDKYLSPEEIIDGFVSETTTTTSVGSYTYDVPAFLDDETANHKSIIQRSIDDGL